MTWYRPSIVFLLLASLAGQACTSCRNTVLAEVPSPSLHWKAGLIARSCGTAHGFVVNVSAQDQPLLRSGRSENTALNLGLPCCLDPEAAENRDLVTIEWTDDRQLRVSYPRSLHPYAYLARSEIAEVEITLLPVETRLERQDHEGQ